MANTKALKEKRNAEKTTNLFENYQRTEKHPVATASSKPTKTNIAKKEQVIKSKKAKIPTTPRTYKMLDVVLDAMEDKFYNERLTRKGMNYQKYVNDLIYRDTHNGQPLYDYETGELIIDIN